MGTSIFMANVTSLSPHALEYLFTEQKDTDILSIVETSITPATQFNYKQKFEFNNRVIYSNNGVPSPLGGKAHGGELHAVKKHLNSMPIDQCILDNIAQQANSTLRISAMIIRLQGVMLLLINAYFYDSIGFKNFSNQQIIQQVYLLTQLFNIPFMLYADFNCTPEDVVESGWLSMLFAQLLIPQGPTSKQSNRIIDFCIVSTSIFPLFSAIRLVFKVPWGPHYGMLLDIAATPLAVKCLKQIFPKDLPLMDFNKEWNTLNDFVKLGLWRKAQTTAKIKLHKQKQRTGVAILGKPSVELNKDNKYQGDFLIDSIRVGESLALQALSSEYLILLTLSIPRKQWHSYIGRSQYPKFKMVSIASNNKPLYKDPDVLYWGGIKTLAAATIQTGKLVGYNPPYFFKVQELQSELCNSVGNSVRFVHDISESLAVCTAIVRSDFKDIVLDAVRDILEVATNNFSCILTVASNQRFSDFKKHLVQQLYKGGGTYFKSISAEDKQYLTVDYAASGGTNRSPTDFLKTQCFAFGKFWHPSLSDTEQSVLLGNLVEYRKHALNNVDSSEHTPYNYKQAILNYNNDTRGSDSWQMKTLKQLPDICIANIADCLKESVDRVALPHQSLCSLNSCLGKPGGGIRTISKLPMTNRLYNKVSTNVNNWEKDLLNNACGSYETAKKGHSALDAALYRNIVAEIAHWLGQFVACALNDYHKFFDTINISSLIIESIYSEYPPVDLALALQQHLAPRVIQVAGFSSTPVSITHSILAGCKQSCPMTKSLLKRSNEELHKKFPRAPPKVYVDDTSMICKENTWSAVQNNLAPCLIRFAKIVHKLNLSLSPKANLCTNLPKLSWRLKNELAEHDIHFKLPSQKGARDLGISFCAGRHRPCSLSSNRIKQTNNRNRKIKKYAKINRKAHVLFKGSSFSAMTYGHPACGIAPTNVKRLESDAVACTGIGKGRDTFTSLVIFYGESTTPYARIISELLNCWFKLLKNNKGDLHFSFVDLRDAWAKAKDTIVKSNYKQLHVKGILSNLIYTLFYIKWNPRSFDYWEDDTGQGWQLDLYSNPKVIIIAMIKSYNLIQCKQSAYGRNGKGMENGCDWNLSLSLHRSLKGPQNYPARCALETISTGACWPEDRILECNALHDATCKRCGMPDSDLHTFWTCEHNNNLEDSEVVGTQKLIDRAVAESEEYPCLWLRGILPSNLSTIPDEYLPNNNTVHTYVSYSTPIEDCIVTSGLYYGDASGGTFSSYPKLTRCGVGFCKVDRHTEQRLWGVQLNLPGLVQTVPRAELFALHFLVNEAQPESVIEFVTDNQKNSQTFNKGEPYARNSINADLFKHIFYNIAKNKLKLTVRWIPSHISEKLRKNPNYVIPEFVSQLDIKANDWADELAGNAAHSVEVPLNVSAPYLYYFHLTRRIQKRHVAILCSLPNRPKHIPKVKLPKEDLCTIIAASKHVIFWPKSNPNWITCARCSCTMHSKAVGVKAWINSQCVGIGKSTDRPIPVFDKLIHIGNNIIHHTHKIYTVADIFYCICCGSNVNVKMKKLKDPCTKTRTKAGQDFLNKINSGNFTTSEPSSSILQNIQSDLNHMELIIQDQDRSSECLSDHSEGQSSLGIPESIG